MTNIIIIKLSNELLNEIVFFLPLNHLKWSKLHVSLIFDIFVLKSQRECIKICKNSKSYFTAIQNARAKLNDLHLNIDHVRSVERLKTLSGHIEAIFANTQLVPLITIRNVPTFFPRFHLIVNRFLMVQERAGEQGIRCGISEKIQILVEVLDLIIENQQEISRNIIAIFYAINKDQLNAVVALLDPFIAQH